MQETSVDVCIVGAGWCGIYATKHMVEYGLSCLCVDERSHTGGLWKFDDRKETVSIADFTWTSTPRAFTEASDFPWPADAGYYVQANTLFAWLQDYIDHFGIRDRFRLQHRVIECRKEQDHGRDARWITEVETSDGVRSRFLSKFLVIASGLNHRRVDFRESDRFKGFSGTFLHSSEVKRVVDADGTSMFDGKTVVAYGGGENATDLAYKISGHTDRFFMCVPRGQWMQNRCFLSRRMPITELEEPLSVDNYGIDARPWEYQNTPFRTTFRPMWAFSGWNGLFLETMNGRGGSGQTAWTPTSPVYRSFGNKADLIYHALAAGRIVAKRDVAQAQDDIVEFTDGSRTRADMILMCTGFAPDLTILNERNLKNPRDWYHRCLDVEDPTLAFVGYVRPVQGSIPQLAEMQCHYIGMVWTNQVALPGPEARRERQQTDQTHWERYFRFTSNRLKGLVDGRLYMNHLGEALGWRFSLPQVLLKYGPRVAWKALWAPATIHLNYAMHPQKAALFKKHVEAQYITSNGLPALNLLFLPYDLIYYQILRLVWWYREHFHPFYRDPIPPRLRGKPSRFERFWVGRIWKAMAFATIIAIATGWNTRSFLLGWLAVGALALTYRQTAVTLFSGLKKIQQQRAVHKSLKNKTAFRRAMLPVAMRMLGLLAIGWGSVFWILF